MQAITRPEMRDQVSEQIKQFIIEKKLMPGNRLPTEGNKRRASRPSFSP